LSQNVIVERALEFKGGGDHTANVTGNMLEKKIHYCYRPGLAMDTTNDFAVSVPGTGDTIAVSEVQGGSWLITTGSVDNDSCMMATPIIFSGTKNAVGEARVKISDVSISGIYVGFSDAKSESNGLMAITYKDDALVTTATDAAGFVCDADSTTLGTSSLLCCGVDSDADATTADTGINWADGETKTLRVELSKNSSGTSTTARFYVDGVQKGIVTSACTAATLQCFTVQAVTRANGGSGTTYVTRIDIWQDE
jgi:hypothetical protein